MLAAADITSLNQKIYKIQKETGVQLAVVLVNEIPQGYTIKTFATQIGKKWHVGTKKRGLVYVAAIQQHLQRLAVAQNLHSKFTDSKSEEILSATKNAYRNEDYSGGLNILINKIHTTLVPASNKSEPTVAEPTPNPAPAKEAVVDDKQKKNDDGDALIGFLFVCGVVAIVLIYRYFKRRQQRLIAENYALMQQQQQYRNNGDYNQGDFNNTGYNTGGGGGYNSGSRSQGNRGSSGIGSFVTGAALGAAGGYGARYLQDKLNEHHNADNDTTPVRDTFSPEISSDNNSGNWGNWGSGDDSDDSGFSDRDDSSSSDSGSSGDSGFSDSADSGSSGDGGSTSNW